MGGGRIGHGRPLFGERTLPTGESRWPAGRTCEARLRGDLSAVAWVSKAEVIHARSLTASKVGAVNAISSRLIRQVSGLRVIREQIPVLPETETICRALALNPLIASGALLIAVAPEGADSVLNAFEAAGTPVVVTDEVRPASEGIPIVTNGVIEPLTVTARDEIAQAVLAAQSS